MNTKERIAEIIKNTVGEYLLNKQARLILAQALVDAGLGFIDRNKIKSIVKQNIQPEAMKIDCLSIKVGKSSYKPCYDDSRELNQIYKKLVLLYEEIPLRIYEILTTPAVKEK